MSDACSRTVLEALKAQNVSLVISLLESQTTPFPPECRKEMLTAWDRAHYILEQKRLGRPLSALMRFRSRQKNPPPPAVGPRIKCTLSSQSKHVLQQWFEHNEHRPYPSRDEINELARRSHLKTTQVKTWFANARRRLRQLGRHSSLTSSERNSCLQSPRPAFDVSWEPLSTEAAFASARAIAPRPMPIRPVPTRAVHVYGAYGAFGLVPF